MPARFILKRHDGLEKGVKFEESEPNWILIKATTDPNGRITPRITDHDRFDFNQRGHDAWFNKMWPWLKNQMELFSEEQTVRAYYINPDQAFAGYHVGTYWRRKLN